jgi:hypothetical protein
MSMAAWLVYAKRSLRRSSSPKVTQLLRTGHSSTYAYVAIAGHVADGHMAC